MESMPIFSIVTNNHVIVVSEKDYSGFIMIYNKFTMTIEKEFTQFKNVSGIFNLKPNILLISHVVSHSLKITEIDLNDLTYRDIFEQHFINFPGFVEFQQDNFNNHILIYSCGIYYLYNNKYELLWSMIDNNIQNVLTTNNGMLHIIKNQIKLNNLKQCSGITAKNSKCKKKSHYDNCHIHRKIISNIICPYTNKTIYSYNTSAHNIFTETNGVFVFYKDNDTSLHCHNIAKNENYTIHMNSESKLIFINNKYFMILDETTNIYNDKCEVVYEIKNTAIPYVHNETPKTLYIITNDDLISYLTVIDIDTLTKTTTKLRGHPHDINITDHTYMVMYHNHLEIYGL
tara:strand:- start:1954 stop:2985 length:1032 start_codon:yes stop_codon:yes gene_type:complete